MKVKIGKTIYDSENEPIMLILNEKDKQNITNMHPSATRFCSYPNNMDRKEIETYMDVPKNYSYF